VGAIVGRQVIVGPKVRVGLYVGVPEGRCETDGGFDVMLIVCENDGGSVIVNVTLT